MLRVEHGDILEPYVDAIVVPQAPQEGLLSELTTRIYNAAGYQNMMVAYNMAKAEAKAERYKEINLLYHDGIPPSSYEISPLIAVTPGFKLKAKYAIHVCIDTTNWWNGQTESERKEKELILSQCYYKLLDCAYIKLGVKCVAIPLLGTSLLGFPEEFSRMVGERAVNAWLKNNTPPLPPGCKQGDEAFVRRWKGEDSPMKIFLVLPISNAAVIPAAPTVAPPAPVQEKSTVIPTPHKTPELVNDDFACAEDIARFEKRYDNARKKKSGRKLEEYNNLKCLEYLSRISNATELAKTLGFHPSNITRYKNFFSGLPNKSKPKPKKIIALSIVIGLNGYERYEFFRCALDKFPYDYEIYNQTERIIRKGIKSFSRINKELCKIDPEFDLTKDKNGQKKKPSAERTA